jgi:hypothetical protein
VLPRASAANFDQAPTSNGVKRYIFDGRLAGPVLNVAANQLGDLLMEWSINGEAAE